MFKRLGKLFGSGIAVLLPSTVFGLVHHFLRSPLSDLTTWLSIRLLRRYRVREPTLFVNGPNRPLQSIAMHYDADGHFAGPLRNRNNIHVLT